jgi:hypothetical protein
VTGFEPATLCLQSTRLVILAYGLRATSLSSDFASLTTVTAEPTFATRSLQVLIWVGGVATTMVGSWIASKIRLYQDDRKSHHQELKDKVLRPLRDFLAENEALFDHREPVLIEKMGYSEIFGARPDQDATRAGLILHRNDPWPYALSRMDRAMFEDAKRNHYRTILAEILGLAASWESHTKRCEMWIGEVSEDILASSEMKAYSPGYDAPYMNHFRLGLWVYRRLFHLPTEALRQDNQGKYWSIEGAPTVSDQIGSATLATQEQNSLLLQKIDKIMAANRDNAAYFKRQSEGITSQAVALRSKLEHEIAKKELQRRCGLVKFF